MARILPLARYGTREILLSALAAAVLIFFCGWLGVGWLSVVPLLLFGWVLAFFRDPRRVPPENPRAVVSPADGTITHIEEKEEPHFVGGRAIMVGIFLSIFNVHLNRAPWRGTVRYLQYTPGSFHDARSEASSAENEQMAIGLETEHPRAGRMLVKQIAGLIARRIVCDVREDQTVERGELIGMIKFGSRTELYLPAEAGLELKVKVGDKVCAGTTVLGELA
jgi:phosphatidylserine decarboxylase